jgi:hypothetical protein
MIPIYVMSESVPIFVDARILFQENSTQQDVCKTEKKICCCCKSSRCIKGYCNCFRNGIQCNISCKCGDCLNDANRKNNPDFKLVIKKLNAVTNDACGCSSTSSRCMKKYCVCFDMGVKCTSACFCDVLCMNGGQDECVDITDSEISSAILNIGKNFTNAQCVQRLNKRRDNPNKKISSKRTKKTKELNWWEDLC